MSSLHPANQMIGVGSYISWFHIIQMPLKWMALESIRKKTYTTKSDVWSYGKMITYSTPTLALCFTLDITHSLTRAAAAGP